MKKMEIPVQIERYEREFQKHTLFLNFLSSNEADLNKRHPTVAAMKRAFGWISDEVNCLTDEPKKMRKDIEVLTIIRRYCERHFTAFNYLRIETRRMSVKVGNYLGKIYHQLYEEDQRRPRKLIWLPKIKWTVKSVRFGPVTIGPGEP